MSKGTKIIIAIAAVLFLVFGIGSVINDTFAKNAVTEEAPMPTVNVADYEELLAKHCTKIKDDLADEHESVYVEVKHRDNEIGLFVYIVDSEITNHAKELVELANGEDAAWQNMKYGLEDYCIAEREEMAKDGIPNPHIFVWVFNEASYQQFADTDGEEDYSVLYLEDGAQVTDIVFDYVGMANKDASLQNGEITTGMENALKSANKYLKVSSFSRNGLVDQLVFEGYSRDEARYAVNNCGADWNEQAVKKATSYLTHMDFSRSGLIEQLEFEGFTHEQAVYGVDSVY